MKLCMGCMNQIEEHMDTCPYCGFNEKTNKQESYYLNPGTVIGGKYIVGKVMNYNGYTISYMGMDAELERKVVVKEYLPSDFATRSEGENDITIYAGDAVQQFEQGLTQFLNDANTMQQIGLLEGIAQVYDCIAENDTGYVVSEYVEGKTLKDVLQNSKKLNPNKAKKIIEKILIGLGQLHAKGIIHCDISPETIVITDNGEVKLIDFGAAKYVTTANSKSLAIILKQGYAPEEQYRSKGIRGSWTDVYAVAAVMYRMITGIVPPESVERALEDNIKEPSKLGINISENLENAIMNALNVYKDNRTISAEIFLKELNSDKVQRIKVKKNKRVAGKIPAWCKILVAGLVVIVIAGGILIYNFSGSDKIGQLDDKLRFSLENDISVEELDNYINKDHNNVILHKEKYPDMEYEYTTECAPGNISSFYIEREDKKIRLNKGDSLENNDTIYYKTARNDTVYYDELNGLKASEIADKLNIEDGKLTPKEDNDNGNLEYDELICINVNENDHIGYKDIESTKGEEIEIAKIDSIEYCNIGFVYKENVSKYKDKNWNDIKDEGDWSRYKEIGKNLKITDTVSLGDLKDSIVKSYYSIFRNSGDVIQQTVKAGEKYDQRENKTFLEIIGTDDNGFGWNDSKNVSIDELKKWIKKHNLNNNVTVNNNNYNDDKIITKLSVTVNGTDYKKDDEFTENDEVRINIESAKSKPTQAPKPTQTPKPKQTTEPKSSSKKISNPANPIDI